MIQKVEKSVPAATMIAEKKCIQGGNAVPAEEQHAEKTGLEAPCV